MRLAVVSRPFNRIGYSVIERILNNTDHEIVSVFLPNYKGNSLDHGFIPRNFSKFKYHLSCLISGAKPVKMQDSILRLCNDYDCPVEICHDINSDSIRKLFSESEIDLLLVAGGWPKLISRETFEQCKLGGLNIHPSLLPEYRGTSVHRWQILHGEEKSGVTFHMLSEEYDSGRIVLQESFSLSPMESPQSLVAKASVCAANYVHKAIGSISNHGKGTNNEDSQNNAWPTWNWNSHGFLKIDWTNDSNSISNLIRACTQESYHYAGPTAIFGSQTWIIREAAETPIQSEFIIERMPGEILLNSFLGELVVCCGQGTALRITRLQRKKESGNSLFSISGRSFVKRLKNKHPIAFE